MSNVTRWLVFSEVAVAFRGLEAPRSAAVSAIRLPATGEPAGTTEWLTYDEVVADQILGWDQAGQAPDRHQTFPTPRAVFTGLPFDRRTGDLYRLQSEPITPAGGRVVPTFLVAEWPGDGGVERAVYSCSRIRESGMLFSRIWAGPVPAGEPLVRSVEHACLHEPGLLARFSDEASQTVRFDADTEIELKLSMLDDTVPWEVAHRLADAVQRRALPGFVPDLGNEMQRWTYEQETFEVVGPPERAGYIAFMTAHDGTYEVKYKFFAEDTLRRFERCVEGVVLEPSQFEDHIRESVPGAELRPLPHMRRTRFDVNVESARGGHYFGLEMDEVWSEGSVLRQLEIEYHKSRAAFGVVAETVEPELFRLSEEVQRLLTEWGIKVEVGYLSKLSFLKGVAGGAVSGAETGR
ncbi:hypothetical protein O7634_18390 [Micromonospora sp. WMMD1120]|uniref:hypothetical protein n=1 Tax=Micromonospora sp. WMMD1120 TaxID=3016106 RepID=UPI0024168B91|nr:hypothetical protein [Micromonospora sp. WMMD1120]MDG4808718.1 hypothetical protein [Micromonospora sp. WMMD1120]